MNARVPFAITSATLLHYHITYPPTSRQKANACKLLNLESTNPEEQRQLKFLPAWAAYLTTRMPFALCRPQADWSGVARRRIADHLQDGQAGFWASHFRKPARDEARNHLGREPATALPHKHQSKSLAGTNAKASWSRPFAASRVQLRRVRK